ncbi:AT-rich interactive domain-containing protein 4 [Camellia lanceoleosa]|uniref:AT-rich interactive domain-containing protein 4 n=1 Tax=Camellia lanceoleosa TaxID=1840588 RepID=A0ACC0FEL1_9ERIC|nr:AT-rich interactive domain-containing protein 4 [Camellia lanceoleosa]
MLGMFASESDSEFESESESESSPTQDLKMKDVDTSSSSRLVYKNPPCKYHVGESSYTFCVICDEVAPNRALVESNKCNHSFCKECICIYIGEKIQENIGKVKCPKPKCKAVLEPYFFRQIVPEEVFWRWADALAESSVLYWQTYLDCPFEDCEERFVDDERGFKIRACPKCWRLFCVVCKTGWHMGKSCLEFQMELEAERARQRHRRKRIVWSESDYGEVIKDFAVWSAEKGKYIWMKMKEIEESTKKMVASFRKVVGSLRTDEGRRSFLISSSGLFEFLNFLIWVGWRLCFGVDGLHWMRILELMCSFGVFDVVQTLNSPSIEELHKILDSSQPNFVYLQGEQLPNDEVGSLVWGGIDVSTAEAVAGLFCSTLPTTVYLEIPNGEKLAEALQSKVRNSLNLNKVSIRLWCLRTRSLPILKFWMVLILWQKWLINISHLAGNSLCDILKNAFSRYAACHFRHALFSVVQSSSSHTWDAFQLAHASLRLYCVRNNLVLPGNSQRSNDKLIAPADDDESSLDGLPAIKIYDDDVNMKFLVCGVACTLGACLLGSLEDGLNALVSIEMRGSKLHNRVSALPPPLQAGTFSRGVVTMRCDLSTCSSAHISLLVSGSAQTCFDDLLLENHIKSEVIEKSQLVHALPNCEENKPPLSEPRRSASIACGAAVFEVCMKVPSWASQVLRQLAPDVSYRSLVALGIASIQGLAVASFEKDDAERLLFFCNRPREDLSLSNSYFGNHPSWLRPPIPSRKRHEMCRETSLGFHNGLVSQI